MQLQQNVFFTNKHIYFCANSLRPFMNSITKFFLIVTYDFVFQHSWKKDKQSFFFINYIYVLVVVVVVVILTPFLKLKLAV